MIELHGAWANDYHFENITDLATAALIKAVLKNLDETHRRELLERIVSPQMREWGNRCGSDVSSGSGGSGRSIRTVEAERIPNNTWISVDKGLIADLINEGKRIDTSKWNEASHNKAYKKTVKFLKYDFLPSIDGVEYVKQMPDELARFLTDCWLAA